MVDTDELNNPDIDGLLQLDKVPTEDLNEFLRTNLATISKKRDTMQLTLSQLLWTVKKTGVWRGWGQQTSSGFEPYNSFDTYLEHELAIRPRRAAYLVELYDKCIIELDIDPKVLANAHWSKVIYIVKFLTEDNHEEILEKISKMTQSEVIRWAKSLRAGVVSTEMPPPSEPAKKEEAPKSITVNISFTPEQYATLSAALAVAEKTTGVYENSHNLVIMAQEFLSSYDAAPTPEQLLEGARRTIACLKNVYGVEIEIKAVDPNINPNWENLKVD